MVILFLQENKKLIRWPTSTQQPCENCSQLFRNIPSFIVLPKNNTYGTIGIHGSYCSWNCAKRGLLSMRINPWFAWLSIVAVKSGAKLPIIASPTQKPPLANTKQICKTPIPLYVYSRNHIVTMVDSEPEPEVFESIIHISF